MTLGVAIKFLIYYCIIFDNIVMRVIFYVTVGDMNRSFKTLEEAVEYLYSEQIEADLIALPPDVDELTDEEDINDELDIPVVNDVPGNIEINFHHEQEVDSEDEDNLPLSAFVTNMPSTSTSSPPAKRKKVEKKNITAQWRRISPSYTQKPTGNTYEINSNTLKTSLVDFTPVNIFEEFFDNNVYEMILDESKRYAATQKNKHDISITIDELKVFVGFLIFSGYHTLPSERDYWSDQEDLGEPIVKNAMSRNAYLELKSIIHFQDNSKANENKNDKSFKISPLFQMINTNFRKWGIFHAHLSIDEMIVRYYGHHSLKQFIKGKPIRFGYKLWALCGEDGFCYNFSLYCGKDLSQTVHVEPLGTRVVTNMLSVVENPESYFIYFDNFFSSHALFHMLNEMGFRATGTIRENRTKKCPMKSSKELEKEERGSYDYQFDEKNEILMVKWNDNKCVSLGSNFDTVEPLASAQRWNKAKMARAPIPQPRIIYNYNRYMGGVDQHDWLLEKHGISIRGKKWYWCLFTRVIDMAIVNAYILYKHIHGKSSISIKDFRRAIACHYLKIGHGRPILKGRPYSWTSTSRSSVSDDVRFDERGHLLGRRDKQRRCQFPACQSKPLTFCRKCNVTLCTPCFAKFHIRN